MDKKIKPLIETVEGDKSYDKSE